MSWSRVAVSVLVTLGFGVIGYCLAVASTPQPPPPSTAQTNQAQPNRDQPRHDIESEVSRYLQKAAQEKVELRHRIFLAERRLTVLRNGSEAMEDSWFKPAAQYVFVREFSPEMAEREFRTDQVKGSIELFDKTQAAEAKAQREILEAGARLEVLEQLTAFRLDAFKRQYAAQVP